jgi:hypothetical protein
VLVQLGGSLHAQHALALGRPAVVARRLRSLAPRAVDRADLVDAAAAGVPRYDSEVALLLRDRASGKPLYETRASHDSSSRADAATVAAMFEAALADFPRPALSPRGSRSRCRADQARQRPARAGRLPSP